MIKRWRVANPCPADFGGTVGVKESGAILSQLLWNRGLRSAEEVQNFLQPSWEDHLHDPNQFRHMAAAMARIFVALERGERITVHGDYDADGVTGSTVLMTTLREIERKIAQGPSTPLRFAQDDKLANSLVDFYIPHRDKEGYGLRRETIPKLQERGTGLIITVDCGIACVEEIALAKEQGMDTIVVDHHTFGEVLPDGFLIHPSLPEEGYPFKHLAAVGVAFKFACALLEEARRRGLDIPVGWEKWLLDLVAIATVTDMVPLIGENRLLETFGLRVLNRTRRPGLRALIEAAGLTYGEMDTESVGFAIGPRLNAAGRMDHASLALRLLLTETEIEARTLAMELERCNRERQEATKRMMEEAERELPATLPKAIVLWKETWSPSLVGLVAGRFVEKFGRPVVAVGSHEGTWIGSGRSIAAYNITAGMRASGEGILTRVGGHVQACGFALNDATRLPELSERLVAHATAALSDEQIIPELLIDAEIPLEAVDLALTEQITSLAPFGMGNARPLFVSRGCSIVNADRIGSTKSHLRLTLLTARGRRVKAIGFKMGERFSDISIGGSMDLVYHVAVNEWNGSRSAECRIVDFVCIS